MGDDRTPADQVEWLATVRPPRRRPRWAWALVGALLLGGGVVVGRSLPAPPPDLRVPQEPPAPSPTPFQPRITVESVGRRQLGVTGDWELYGRGDGEVVRVELGKGRITRTSVPPLDSTGHVSFLVTGDQAVIRPLDVVTGYAVADGQPARPLPASLSSGVALPGPTPGTVWAVGTSAEHAPIRLVRVPASGSPEPVVLVRTWVDTVAADGTGSFVVRPGQRRTLVYGKGALVPVSDGTLVAAGPRTWVSVDCPDSRCRPTVADRRTGKIRKLRTQIQNRWMTGAVSPDGRTVALLPATSFASETVRLVDLISGKTRQLDVRPDPTAGLSALAWSPDSRWLCVAGDDGRVWVVRPRRDVHEVVDLGVPVRQLAVKP